VNGQVPFWPKLLPQHKMVIARDKNKAFQPSTLKHKSPSIIDGYWQSEKYFVGIEDVIREEIKIRPEHLSDDYHKVLAKLKEGSFVSLHVRRGDYVKVGAPLASIHYYEEAIEKINKMAKKVQFLVFSDDIGWVKENLKIDFPVVWMENDLVLKDFESLQLMSKCSHHIIGNSTYSWWGAWLNPNKNKTVMYPKIARTHLNVDLMTPEWVGI
jgi:glycosyl transferase family 11